MFAFPPATRTAAAADNAQAAARRSKTGGPFGPDTCLAGFVWREVIPTDHVCVTPQVRQQVSQDIGCRFAARYGAGLSVPEWHARRRDA
jgi:hypothetical protein